MTTIERFDIRVGSLTFQARRAGPADGPPVIFLHGVPETSICWEAQLEALGAAGRHAVAYTQRGFCPGARIDDPAEFTMDKLVDDVASVADALGFDQFDLVGHDMGCSIGWFFATRYPDLLHSLTTISVPHPNAYSDAYFRRIADPGPGPDQYDRAGYARDFRNIPRGEMERALVADDCRQLRAAYVDLPDHHVAEYVECLGTEEGIRGVIDVYRSARAFDEDAERLPPITVPTLFIWSDEDSAIAAGGAYATGDHVDAPYRFVTLEGVDHWIPERVPERVSEELLAHLRQHSR